MQTEKPQSDTHKHRHPGSVVIAVAFVAGLAELGYAVMNFSAMPVYLKYSLDKGADAVAWMSATFLICEGVVKGPFGILGDRIGRKKLIIAGPMISVFTALLTLLVDRDHWYLLFFLRVMDGLGAAALWPSALAMIADVVEEKRRSQAMSLFNVTYMIGIGVGPFIGGATNDLTHTFAPHVDPRQASFFLISFLFMLTTLVAWRRIPNIRPHHEHHAEHEAGFSLKALLSNLRQIPETLILGVVTFFGIGLILPLIKLFAMDEYRISETMFGVILLVPSLIIAVASVPLGTIGDRIGKPRAVRLGLGLCATSMWVMGLVRGEVALIIGGSLIGVGFVIAFPSWIAHVSSRCDPGQRGAVMGAVGTAQGFGAMIGAPLGGYLYEHANIQMPVFMHVEKSSHYAPFLGCASFLVVAWLLATFTIKDVKPGVPGHEIEIPTS